MRRFCYTVLLFLVSIFLLVFSGNFIITMVGWDGLGLVSFCLVIFYVNSSRLESGLVTVFRNRVGDLFFLLSFFFMRMRGTFIWDFVSNGVSIYFLVFLFFGAITKSAQVPFSAWLPAAMAAPTPVSSLVHSSTLVTAGVYVLVRYHYLFSFFSFNFFKFFLVLTMVLAGGFAVLERDFKKIVAISTLRQLGMIIFILSVGMWILSFLHIVIHAFFKSILFLRTGSLIIQKTGAQDSRLYGSSVFSFFSFLYFMVRCVCLAGFPFFLGFYSKDFIISSLSSFGGFLLYLFFLIGCFFTVIYRVRLINIAYTSVFKYIPYGETVENIKFFFTCDISFYKMLNFGWYSLLNLSCRHNIFFLVGDLLVGLLLIFGGTAFFYYIRFLYFISFSFGGIFYLRWMANGGSSYYFNNFHFVELERSWIETLGGAGVYLAFSRLNSFFMKISLIGISFFLFLLIFLAVSF